MKINPDELYDDIIQEHPELNTREARPIIYQMCVELKNEIDRCENYV